MQYFNNNLMYYIFINVGFYIYAHTALQYLIFQLSTDLCFPLQLSKYKIIYT